MNLWTLAIGAGVLVAVIVADRLDHRVPGALVGLVASTALVAGLSLKSRGVEVLGNVVGAAPRFGLRCLS